MGSLKDQYKNECKPALQEEFGYKNVMQIPKLEKIILNMGLGEAVQNPKIIDGAVEELTNIAGRKAVVTRAKKSIAGFKLREGMPIGCRVTLRGDIMYDFFSKLVNVALPRVRDFRGVSPKSFDGRGNFSMGVKEQIIFPEIDYDKIDKIKGLNISIVTSAPTDKEGFSLLKSMGMPFKA
ncbi:MAG: 50S ribosomal protein L5 [Desulfocapsa sp.]|nr:50S ribosomal protein L5 [Desulfocapsa sp.]